MNEIKKWNINAGVFLVAMVTLLFELTMVKIFDVLWYPNLGFMVISLAMFSLGLAGVIGALRPFGARRRNVLIACFTIGLAVSMIAIFPVLHQFHFYMNMLNAYPLNAIRNIFIVVFFATLPFLFSGLVLTTVFACYSQHIRRLYFFDLFGASLGCLLIIPLLPKITPAGLIIFGAGLALLAAGVFSQKKWGVVFVIAGMVVAAAPFAKPDLYHIELQMNKRGILIYKSKIELTYWDPISRIDVINFRPGIKWIAYDGGQQTSYFYYFDGDYKKLRRSLDRGNIKNGFWGWPVVASHFLKRDTHQDVLIIGSAGGMEMKGALAYGARSVDGIELVGEVVHLGKTKYAKFTGNVFNDPRVHVQRGEGRTFLRSTNKRYDIIQMMSNHTSSSIAAGSSALDPTYLQTAEAYVEYFSHLKKDGLLHINHHVYPKMLVTAAVAWKMMGRTDFRKHVAVFEAPDFQDNLPTFMIKMSPWKKEEIEALKKKLPPLVVDPFDPQKSFLPAAAFEGRMPRALLDATPYRLAACSDNKPYFNCFRKLKYSFKKLKEDKPHMLNLSTALLLNSQIHAGFPMDIIHLYVVGAGAVLFALLVVLVPLLFSRVGREKWAHKKKVLGYFAMLGLGFILFELVSIHLFLKLIGYPLYAYTTVVFGYLVGAGVGSYASEKLGIGPDKRWWVPFLGIGVAASLVLTLHGALFGIFLQDGQWVRIAVALAMIIPLAFFLGMAFPLGVLRLSRTPHKNQAIAWAWGINGLFTVIGGFLSVILSLYLGFTHTLMIAMACYLMAFVLFRSFRHVS